MKRLVIILAMLAVSVSALAQSGRQLYSKYSDLPGTEAVYVSPAMFRLIGRLPDIDMQEGKVNLSAIIKSMTGFYIVSTSNPDVGAQLHADVTKFIDSGKYELLMEAKEDGEVMRMYTVGDEKTVNSFVMLSKDRNEVSYICFDGKMDRAQLENILADVAAD